MIIHDGLNTKSIGSMFHVATCDTDKEAADIVTKFMQEGYPYISSKGKEIWVNVQNFGRAADLLQRG